MPLNGGIEEQREKRDGAGGESRGQIVQSLIKDLDLTFKPHVKPLMAFRGPTQASFCFGKITLVAGYLKGEFKEEISGREILSQGRQAKCKQTGQGTPEKESGITLVTEAILGLSYFVI